MSANRSVVRKQIAALLQAALVGDGKPVVAVYDYQPATFDKQSPVVTVSSGGSVRPILTHRGTRSTFTIYIHVFVLYADKNSGWNEQNAEDRLDLIEAEITQVLSDHKREENYWELLHREEPSTCTSVQVGGNEYRLELIPAIIEVPA
jgi:hypothetical protein